MATQSSACDENAYLEHQGRTRMIQTELSSSIGQTFNITLLAWFVHQGCTRMIQTELHYSNSIGRTYAINLLA